MRLSGRDRSGARYLRLVAPQETCPFCAARLRIYETQDRYVQTLTELLYVVGKGKKCMVRECGHGALRYRPPEVGRLVLKAHEFGRDVVLWAGDQHIREKLSIPRIHKRLVGDFHVPISERSVGNLVDDYVALCHCVAGDEGRVRERLEKQQGMVLCVDGVHFDGVSPVLYVQREVISGEVLYAERRLARSKDDLVPMLRRTAELAQALKIPILAVVSDKETSLVPAIAEVFPEIPHQFCQTHFLKNVATGYKEDDQELARASKETVLALRDVQRTIERRVGANRADKKDEEKDTTKEPSLAVATAVAAWARAGTIAGMASGRAITDPPGLKRFQKLQQVREAMEEAVKAKKNSA